MVIDKAYELLEGACDMHVHGGPDVTPRRQDIIDIAEEAFNAGMAAVVFKDHYTCTADRAYVAGKAAPGINIFGGIVLNHAVGGFNVHAVDMAVRLGAKVVWMPSIDAAYTVEKVWVTDETPWLKPFVRLKNPEKGLSIFKEGGESPELIQEVKEIIDLLRGTNVILDTCHCSPRETYSLVRQAKDAGLERIVVTHPNCSVNRMTIAEQKELAGMGAYLAYAFLPCMPMFDGQRPVEIARMISEVGAKNCILISDFGQSINPSVVEGMRMFIAHMLAAGIPEEDVRVMVRDNPQWLLGLR